GLLVAGIADFERVHQRDQCRDEGVVRASLDVDTLHGDAALSCERERVLCDLRGRQGHVRVRRDDHGRRVPELEVDALLVCALAQSPADTARAGERDQLHAFVLDEDVAEVRRRPDDDVQPARRQAGLLFELCEQQRRQRVWLAGLSTTAQPAASAGASLWATRLSGKLKGLIAPTMPTGCRSVKA